MEFKQAVEALVGPLAKAAGLELVLVECVRAPGRWIVRVFVDRPEGGPTVGDCAGLSRGVGAALEAADVVPGSFTLEVSSPGLDRPLTRPEQFARFLGERVAIVTLGEGPGRRRIEGILESCTPADVTVVTDDGRRDVVRFEEMAKARLIADPWRGRGGESGRRGGRKGQ